MNKRFLLWWRKKGPVITLLIQSSLVLILYPYISFSALALLLLLTIPYRFLKYKFWAWCFRLFFLTLIIGNCEVGYQSILIKRELSYWQNFNLEQKWVVKQFENEAKRQQYTLDSLKKVFNKLKNGK